MERPRIQPRITLSGQVRSARLRSEQPSNPPGGTNKIHRMLGNLKRLRMCSVTLVLLSRFWCARRTLMTERMGQRPGSSRTLGVTSLEGGTLVTFLTSYKTPERSRLRAEGLFGFWFCGDQGRASKLGGRGSAGSSQFPLGLLPAHQQKSLASWQVREPRAQTGTGSGLHSQNPPP